MNFKRNQIIKKECKRQNCKKNNKNWKNNFKRNMIKMLNKKQMHCQNEKKQKFLGNINYNFKNGNKKKNNK